MTMWLFLEKDNTVAAIQKYGDKRGSIYVFDSTVPRCSEVKARDTCVYRLNNEIYFVGSITNVSHDEFVKEIKICPNCGRQNTLRPRQDPSYPFKCGNCGKTFSKDIVDKNIFTKKVLRYQADYNSIDISNYKIPIKEVKSHIITKEGRVSPKNQGSIVELDSIGIIALLDDICGNYVTEWLSSSQILIDQKGLEEGRFRPPKERRKNSYEQNRAVEERAYDVAESYFNRNSLKFKWVGDDRGIENKHCDYQVFDDEGQLIKNVEVKGLKGTFDTSTKDITVALSRREYELARGSQENNMMALLIVYSIKVDRCGNEYKGRDGELLVKWDWSIDQDGLVTPSGYEYRAYAKRFV